MLWPAEERGSGELLLSVGCLLDYIDGAPALVVEIVESPDAAREIRLDPAQYLAAGAQAVWILYRDSSTVHVYEGLGASARVLKAGEMLEAPGVVPGWAVPVEAVFAGGRPQ